MTLRVTFVLAVLFAVALPGAFAKDEVAPVTSEEVALADALLDADAAMDALLALWERASADASKTAPEVKLELRTVLRRRWMAAGNFGNALPHAEALYRLRGTIEDKITYGEALLGAVRSRLQRGPSISANINPYLSDLRTATENIDATPDGGLTDNQRVRVVYTRAHGLFLSSMFDEAVAWVESSQPKTFDVGMQSLIFDVLARSHYEQKRFDKSAQAFANGGNGRGAAATWAAGKHATETADAYAELVAANPKDEVIAAEALRSVRFAGATESFLAKLAAMPESVRETPMLLEVHGRLLAGSEQIAEATEIWRRLRKLSPDRPGIQSLLARSLLSGPGRTEPATQDEALTLLESATEADPEDTLALGLLDDLAGRTYSALWRDAPGRPRYQRCIRALRAFVKARPDDATAWANLANTLRVGGDTQAAHKAYVRAREENPYDPAIASDLGLVLSALGRAEDALAAFEESVRLDPGHLAGRQNAARSLWRLGRDAEAAAHLAIGARTARARGMTGMTYRILMDRTWRTRRNPALR